MRTTTAAWTAALAVMSMHGPFTTAEAAPARHGERHQPRNYVPKHERRGGYNATASAVESSSNMYPDSSPSPQLIPDVSPGPTSDLISSSPSSRRRSSTKSTPHYKHVSVLDSLLTPGASPSASISSQSPDSSDAVPLPLTSSESVPAVTPSPVGTGLKNGPLQPSASPNFKQPQPVPFLATGQSPSSSVPAYSSSPPFRGNNNTYSSSSFAPIIVGISTVVSQTPATHHHHVALSSDGTKKPQAKATQHGLLSDLGISGLPTGSVLPTNTATPNVVNSPLSLLSDGTHTTKHHGKRPHKTATTGTGGIVQGVSSALQATGTGGVVQSITPSMSGSGMGASSTTVVPAIVSSLQSEVTQVVSSLAQNTDGAPTDQPLSVLQSSLDSKVSDILSTVTDPAVVSSLTSAVSSIYSSAASDLGTNNSNLPVTTPALTVTGGGSTVVLSVPTSVGTSPTVTGITSPETSPTTSLLSTIDSATTDLSNISTPTAESNTTTPAVTYSSTNAAVTTSSESPAATSTFSTPATPTSSPFTVSETSVAPQFAPHSIKPTATNSQTALKLPTVWTFAPTTTAADDSSGIAIATSSTSSGSTGLPTYMPQLIQPPGGMPEAPANSTLIQVGFDFGLNYPFVVSQQESASQIFAYLPQGVAYGLGISKEAIVMNALLPYDTSQTLHYITTLAQAYVPSDLVTQMQLDLHISNSLMYSNPDSTVHTLMKMINPTIPILPGAAMDGVPILSAGNPAATASSSAGDGAPLGGDSSSAKAVNTTSVSIGMGAVAGAAVYAAAMIYVARRYRQKRKGHQRASSVPTAGEMSQVSGGGMGGFFMSGANGRNSGRDSNRGSAAGSGGRYSRTSAGSSNGRSVREQGISAPIMSENSLGWT